MSDTCAVAIQEAPGLRWGVEFEDMDAGMSMLDGTGEGGGLFGLDLGLGRGGRLAVLGSKTSWS